MGLSLEYLSSPIRSERLKRFGHSPAHFYRWAGFSYFSRMNWTNYPNFKAEEFRCKHTGKDGMHPDFMQRLQALRNEYGKGMKVTSGYRDKLHPIEARKQTTGAHTTGRAVDIAVEGADALRLVALALKHGFTGIGVQQKGSGRFIHLDDISGNPSQPRPHIWSY